jgi:hypothetical protein
VRVATRLLAVEAGAHKRLSATGAQREMPLSVMRLRWGWRGRIAMGAVAFPKTGNPLSGECDAVILGRYGDVPDDPAPTHPDELATRDGKPTWELEASRRSAFDL